MANATATTAQPAPQVTMKLAHSTTKSAPFVPGRRKFLQYRDLGVTEATGGALRAQVMSAVSGMEQPTGWHYHTCETQFVYVLKGWVDLEFETGEKIRLESGDSLMIPGGMRHNEIGLSEDFELLEVSTPAELGTVPCDAP